MSAPRETPVAGRPAVAFSLAVNYALGGLDPKGYHVFNIAVHLLCTLLLFGIVRRTLLSPRLGMRFSHSAPYLAGATALLWAVHPLQTDAVTYIVQRTESLMALSYLLTLYCAIRGWSAVHRRAWNAGAVVSCALGMISKEVMVSAPLMVLLYDRVFVSGTWREALRRSLGLYAGLAATWVVLAALVVGAHRTETVGFALGVTWREYMWTQTGVILHYLRLCFWPTPLLITYDSWPIAHEATRVWPHAVAVLALLAATAWACRFRPSMGFAGIWFFIILAPTSSILPIITEVAAERRMYLSSVAVVVLTVTGVYLGAAWLAKRLALPRSTVPVCLGALVAVATALLGQATIKRNRDYHSAALLWTDMLAKRPNSAIAQHGMGEVCLDAGRSDEAIRFFNRALELKPAFPEALTNLATALAQQTRYFEAAIYYREALQLRPDSALVCNNLANALAAQGKTDEAIEYYEKALSLDATSFQAHNNLANALAGRGLFEKALPHYVAALQAHPDFAEGHANFGYVLEKTGQKPEAIAHYQEALRLKPELTMPRARLDNLLNSPPPRQ